MKITLFIATFLLSIGLYAQSDTLNQIDSAGKKQGYWIIYGKNQPQKGFPVEGKIAEGAYLDDRRNGEWIMYYKDGVNPKIKGYFINNRPNGPFESFYLNGNLQSKGTFNKMSYIGEWTSYWENGNLMTEGYYNEKGNKDGKEIHYFENTQVELEMKFNNGLHVDTIIAYYPNGDIRYMAILDSLGREIEKFTGPQKIRDSLAQEINYRYLPIGCDGKITEKSHYSPKNDDTLCFDNKYFDTNEVIFKPDGYNKLYTKDKNLLVEGYFKNGCLWNGKHYVYDKDGLLMNLEIWKEGNYVADGQL